MEVAINETPTEEVEIDEVPEWQLALLEMQRLQSESLSLARSESQETKEILLRLVETGNQTQARLTETLERLAATALSTPQVLAVVPTPTPLTDDSPTENQESEVQTEVEPAEVVEEEPVRARPKRRSL